MEIKHYRCANCDAIQETGSDDDLSCMNCDSSDLELIEDFLNEKNNSFCEKAGETGCEGCNGCN